MVRGIYSGSEVVLQVNSRRTDPIEVKSGTKQGCPLSPLLFAIVAEVLTQNIINDKAIKGVQCGNSVIKVSAYADDNAIDCGDLSDYNRVMQHLSNYEKATGMLRNVKKTEVVSEDIDIVAAARAEGFAVPKEVRYLGCPVGFSPDYSKLWSKVVAKMNAAATLWCKKTTAVSDRVLLAKALILSKVWYYGSILPLDPKFIVQMEKIVKEFIWGYKVPKVGQKQMQLCKAAGGLNVWDLAAKDMALNSNWILKYVR